jgi:mono/diheme cytochrome c family protein
MRFPTPSKWLCALALGAGSLLFLSGCRQDMQDQPKYIPLRAIDVDSNQPSVRMLPEGVVAYGHLDDDTYLYTGKFNGQDGTVFPFAITAADLQRGKERFEIYCTPCHSPLGDGRGMVVRRGFQQPPTYHDDRLRNAPIGHFFDVISNGFGAMPDYRSQIPDVNDRWRIVAYIRALQLSEHATLADVPQAEQGNIGAGPAPETQLGGAEVTPPEKIVHPNSRGQQQ